MTARSVHSTSDIDIYPQGHISTQDSWYLDNRITFTQENADYTSSMVEDNRITFEHSRPTNLQTLQMWAQASPTDSQYVTGAPDLSYSYTKGPVIELTDFDTESSNQYEIVAVDVIIAFHIPGPLLQDQVRFSMENNGDFHELVTYVNTQGSIDYMNGSLWSENITDKFDWTWSDLQNLILTLDYVSLGGTDDTQLDVDAVGLSVIVEYPWYGTEWASVESTSQGFDMPMHSVNFEEGYFDNIQLSSCGLSPVTQGVEGVWISEILFAQPGQTFGRIHFDGESNYQILMAESIDGSDFTEYVEINDDELIESEIIRIQVKSSESCIESIFLDYNDPNLTINGRVFGSLEGLATDYSRWKVFVNGQEAAYQTINQLGNFNLDIPIGQYLQPGIQDLSIKLQAWFNWDSTGTMSTTLLEVTSMTVTGGFEVQWDEDPDCQTIGPQYFVEDGLGVLIPFLDRCIDDRTNSENLSVLFSVADESLVSATMVQDDIKLVLMPEQHGVTTVTVTVSDEAGNTWQETFIVSVEEIDDKPEMGEFPSIVPVEYGVTKTIQFSYTDIDSTGITATTDKSWAVIDLSTSTIRVTPPNAASSVPVIVTLCDQTSCVNQTLVLEVLTLAELFIEEIVVDKSEVTEGDVVPVKIYIRNSGNSEATLISIRCQTGSTLVGIMSIPMLQSNELGMVTCDWKTTENGPQTLSVEIDRTNQILESDEENNFASVTIDVAKYTAEDSSSDTIISTSMLWIITVIVVALIVVLFSAFAPGKIKKL
ncbi:MAG: CARDB domain-containing protein [Candidatus Poseidoniaceae archaeon]